MTESMAAGATSPETRVHYRTCNLCEAMCGLAITLRGEKILAIRGDKADPLSQGHICPKAVALQDIHQDPDRLKLPVRRTAEGWQTVEWEEAFDEVAASIKETQKKHGRDAVGIYLGNPNVHSAGSLLFGPPLVRALRTRNRYSATSADQLPHHFAAFFMFGHQLSLPVPDIDRTQFMLILGANPLVSNGSLMTAPGVGKRLKRIQNRGGRVVVIDPRRTETAEMADAHYFIRPGTDALLLLSLLHTIVSEGLARPGRLAQFTDGLDKLPDIVAGFSPAEVSSAVGIDADEIKSLARAFAAAESAVCYGRMGASTQRFGGLAQWLINVINLVTGNLDRPGGAMFTTPAFDVVGITSAMGATGRYGRWKSRVRGRPEFGGELPVSVLAEEILTPGEGQIKALVTVAGNPVLSTPNGRQLDQALSSLDFMVAVDIYINETTRHANIILPPATGLECEHYDLSFHALAVRNTVKFSPALFSPAPGALYEWQIFRELRARLTPENDRHSRKDIFQRMPPGRIIDLGLRYGPYGAWRKEKHDERNYDLTLRKVKRDVHGLDLGPLRRCLPDRLYTPNQRIQLVPEVMFQDLGRLQNSKYGFRESERDLLLIGRRQLRSNNSWMHNSRRLVRGRDRCTLLIHPNDASERSICDGQWVEVGSRTGILRIRAEINNEMMPGVVSIPHGWGHDLPGVILETAAQHPGASINDVTDDQFLDELTGNVAFNGVSVKVKPAETE